MNDYLVTWKIHVDAATPREAAETAQSIQRDPLSTATVFDVNGTEIDLPFQDDENGVAFRLAARRRYVCDDIEIDADAAISASDEGAFVQAWVWVPNDDIKEG